MAVDSSHAVVESNADILVAFISHSWRDAFVPEAVEGLLKEFGIGARYDRTNLTLGDELSSGIDELLEESDFVLALLTPNSVASLPVREELTRAHERRIRIFPVVQKSVIANLPSFLRDSFYTTFSEPADIEAAIRSVASHARKHLDSLVGERAHHRITQIHQSISRLPYRKEKFSAQDAMILAQATAVMSECEAELASLADQKYRISISASATFLKRCKPVFEHANELFAVSRDDISDFWISSSSEDATLAQDYLESNPKNTVRLFVFRDAARAHKHAHILNIHHRYYGSTGAVLVTSQQTYNRMLQDWGLGSSLGEREVDFALLNFRAQDDVFYEAMLGRGVFQVRHLGSRPGRGYNYMRDFFRVCTNLSQGETNSDYAVGRWKFNYQQEPSEFAGFLTHLFEAHCGPAFHVVVFRGYEDRELLRHLLQIKVTKILDELSAQDDWIRKGLQGFWVTEWFDPRAHDPVSTGRIPVHSNNWPTALIMQFSEVQAVKGWQELVTHSFLREEAHELFSPELKAAYEEIKQMKQDGKADSMLAAKYEDVENMAAEFMSRLDYKDALTIPDLVHRKAFRPPVNMSPKVERDVTVNVLA